MASLILKICALWVALVICIPVEAAAKSARAPQAAAIFDADKRKRTRHQISDYFSASFYLNLGYFYEKDRKRDDNYRDTNEELSALIGFVGKVQLSHRAQIFVHAEANHRDRWTELQALGRITDPQLKEALLSYNLGAAGTVSVGRLRLSDLHRWSADASVDGIHWGRRSGARLFELAAFQGTRSVTGRYLLAHYGAADVITRWGVIGLAERDGDAKRLHLAGYFERKPSDKFQYQINAGAVFGDAADGKRWGAGFDVRAIHKLDGTWNPQLTYGFAMGSTGYLQSGLHTNKTYDGGLVQVHRYGYAYQPELTNLAVFSVGFGIRPSRKLSADVILSAYAQPSLRTIGPDARFVGMTTDSAHFLGTEIAAVGAWRPRKRTKVEFGVGHFKPGPAYLDRSSHTRLFARISIQF